MGLSGLLLLDKEQDWTSQDCVAKLRGVLREKRVGHAGTLDPLATGLLVILVGRATRAAAYAETQEKEYVAAFRPGLVTDTQDITGNLLQRSDVLPSEEEVRAMLPRFTGRIEQIPPMYSAIKINGRKLYEVARKGGTVERAPRDVTIHELEYLGREPNGDHRLRIRCSKGTYIRTLCHDLGQALGCGGCMAALRRTASGAFRIEDAVKIGQVTPEVKLLGVDVLFSEVAPLTLTPEQERMCRCGSAFAAEGPEGEYRFYSGDGAFLALGRIADGSAVTIKSFFEVG